MTATLQIWFCNSEAKQTGILILMGLSRRYKILLMISEVCIILIIHNSTCIPPALAPIVPTRGAWPLKTHLFASQDPIQMHHPKSARVGCAEWGIGYLLHSASFGQRQGKYKPRAMSSAHTHSSSV